MMQFHPFSDAPPQQVHAGWIDQALPDIDDKALRQSILSSTQFAERIVAGLAGSDAQAVARGDDHAIRTLIGFITPTALQTIGQLWFAPVLAATVLSPSRQLVPEIESRDQLRRLVRYRHHTASDVVGALPESPDYAHAGASCVAAWLSAQPQDQITRRLRLVLPPQLCPATDERCALVARILSDPEFRGN